MAQAGDAYDSDYDLPPLEEPLPPEYEPTMEKSVEEFRYTQVPKNERFVICARSLGKVYGMAFMAFNYLRGVLDEDMEFRPGKAIPRIGETLTFEGKRIEIGLDGIVTVDGVIPQKDPPGERTFQGGIAWAQVWYSDDKSYEKEDTVKIS